MKRGTIDYAITMSGILQIIVLLVNVFLVILLDILHYHWQTVFVLPVWGLMLWGTWHLTERWTEEANKNYQN